MSRRFLPTITFLASSYNLGSNDLASHILRHILSQECNIVWLSYSNWNFCLKWPITSIFAWIDSLKYILIDIYLLLLKISTSFLLVPYHIRASLAQEELGLDMRDSIFVVAHCYPWASWWETRTLRYLQDARRKIS